MSGKESKHFEKFKQELKAFFRGNKNNPGLNQTTLRDDFTIAIKHQLSDQFPIHQRLKILKELEEVILNAHLEQNTIEAICSCVSDILNKEKCKESRQVVYNFYQVLVESQYDQLGIMRQYFFKVIKNSSPEDHIQRFELFQKLTGNGRNIVGFEEEVGQFLLGWMPAIVAAGKTSEFLQILVNFIKYNSAYTDDDVINGIVQNTAFLCCHSDKREVVIGSLDVLNAIVCYSNLSQQTMVTFISALSRTIILEKYGSASWNVMKNLLGTHMGPFCIQTLCCMLQEDDLYNDVGLISGIIFILNMALLNNKPDFIIGHVPTCIIPSIFKASTSNNPVILVEVCLCIKWLVEKYGEELKEPTWDTIYKILEPLIFKMENKDCKQQIHKYISDVFLKVEILCQNNQRCINMEKLFEFAQKFHYLIPNKLIFRLTDYFFKNVVSIDSSWIYELEPFLTNFLINEVRTDVKIYVLNKFVTVIQDNRYLHEQEIVNDIIKPYFSILAFEKNYAIRNTALEFLIEFCSTCKPSYIEPILDILDQVLRVPFEQNLPLLPNDMNDSDIKIVVKGLLDIFISSIYHLPTSNAIKILNILVFFLKNHYEKPNAFDFAYDIRWMIIDGFLKLRTDTKCRIGFLIENNIRYSPYLRAEYSRSSNSSMSSSSRMNSKSSENSSFEEDPNYGFEFTIVPLTNMCRVIEVALREELDWSVLKLILQAIPVALRNRALVFSKYNCKIEPIINVLISMITDGNLPEPLKNVPPKFSKPDFYGYVVPVLSAFASYHTHLEFVQQQRLIKCLQIGLVYKSAPQCVKALMICLLEMREAMVKLLPEVLLNLSKISATVHVAIPILEFLSMLTTFPQVFSNFTPNQYMSIFAIIFPYTNPFKYHHYTVSLAHHVIAVWFLKCRRPLRRDFVQYIIKGLKSNVSGSFDDSHSIKKVANEDSSNRKRSSSLTEQGNRRKDRHMSDTSRLMPSQMNPGVSELRKDIDETAINFHRELTETCIDFMSRVAFTNCSALPIRHPSTEFILRNGQSTTWLLGSRLITITTSGCTQKPLYNGLCEKCYSSCVIDSSKITESSSYEKPFEGSYFPRDNQSNFSSGGKQLSRHLSINSEDSTSGEISRGSVSTENISNSSNQVLESEERRSSESIERNKQMNLKEEREIYDVCTCWCQGWAEVHIRRPTGDTAWLMRLQNETFYPSYPDPLIDASTINQASVIQEGNRISCYKKLEKMKIQNESKSSEEETTGKLSADNSSMLSNVPSTSESKCVSKNTVAGSTSNTEDNSTEQEDEIEDYDPNNPCSHNRNPVRRSNSSPEMSSSWKSSFIKNAVSSGTDLSGDLSDALVDCKKLGKNCYSKELIRCDCEAIPEEFPGLGTTPPKHVTEPASEVSLTSESESFGASTLPASPCNMSRTDVSNSAPQLPPSHSCEYVDLSSDKKNSDKFFDDGLPNVDFEFSRSASTSQVISSFRKHPPSTSYTGLSNYLTVSQPHLTAKPPLSPPTHSLKSMNKHGKDYSSADSQSDSFNQLNQEYKRNRVHTISVMSPTKKHSDWDVSRSKFSGIRSHEPKKSGINPSFVFLQLYDSSQFFNSSEKPLLIPSTPAIQRALNVFDHIPPYETHKIGVIYVGPGQVNNEAEILRNITGSTRYAEFLSKLGTLVNLSEVNPQNMFLGGLEQTGNDGKFSYIWKDEIMQIIFHVATLMPNKDNDINCNNKKKHIGNDYVTIVFNESGKEYDLHTVKCQFNFACIIVEPLDHGSNQLTVKAREDLINLIGNVETKIVSDKNVSLFARQLALHINLASLVLSSMKDRNHGAIYASNWLERLRKIKQIKKKVSDDELKLSTGQSDNVGNKQLHRRNDTLDFTEYT